MTDICQRIIPPLAHGWRIVPEGNEFCLQEDGPFAFEWWVEVAGPGSLEYCRYAYDVLREGESPMNYDDWIGGLS